MSVEHWMQPQESMKEENSRQNNSDSDEDYRWDSDYEEWVRVTDDDDDWWDEDVYYE